MGFGSMDITALVTCPNNHAAVVAYRPVARCPVCGAVVDWKKNGYVLPEYAQYILRLLWTRVEQDPYLPLGAEDVIIQFLEAFEDTL